MDDEQIAELYARLRGPLFSYAAARLSSQQALDVVHDTFEVVLRKRRSAPARSDEWAAWCFGIARNKILQEAQHTQRKHHDSRFAADFAAHADLPAAADVGDQVAEAHHGRAVWDLLSAAERELLTVTLTTRHSSADAAALLGTSYTAYTTRVARLRTRILRLLESDDADR